MSEVENIFKYLLLSLMLASILLGIIGNVLSYLVFSLSPKLRQQSISIYFRAIAIVDTLTLVNGILHFLTATIDFNLSQVNEFFCKTKGPFSYTVGAVSPWLMVVVSIDRFISIRFPRRFPALHKTSLQIGAIMFVLAFNFLFYVFLIWDTEFYECNFNSNNIFFWPSLKKFSKKY